MKQYELPVNQTNLYSDLIREYTKEQWFKVCNLEKFIQIKIEKAMNSDNWNRAMNLQVVLDYAENDY